MTLTLKPYPAYKHSGAEWLGDIPAHWHVQRGGNLFMERVQVGFPDLPILEVSLVTGVRVRDLNDSTRKQIMSDRSGYKKAHRGDLPYNMMRMWQGAVGIAPVDGLVSPAYVVLRPRDHSHSRFYERMFRTDAFKGEVGRYSRGIVSDRDRLYWEDFKRLHLPVPPLDEQRAIADFLDEMDARISRFIAAKRRMIALLEEKKQAIINQAVTRGLDPDVPLKDSGVDWLGEIPLHWDVAKVKQVAKLESGHTPSRTVPEHWLPTNDIPWVSLNDTKTLARNDYISETVHCINALGLQNSSARLLPSRAVVFTRDATIGKAAITTRPMAVSQHLIAWLCGPRLHPEYLLHVFYALERVLELFTFGATIRTIGMDDVRKLTTPVPPLEEQIQIAQMLTQERNRIDVVIGRAQRKIELIQEYRTRLISDVVTGKLDVRGVELPAIEEAVDAGMETMLVEPEDDSDQAVWDQSDTIEEEVHGNLAR